MPSARELLDVATATKSFRHAAVGNAWWNAAGGHLARMVTADVVYKLRRLMTGASQGDDLARLGYSTIEGFMPRPAFERVRDEVEEVLTRARSEHPWPKSRTGGFGAPRPFAYGFDRFDGDTLNRFVRLDPPLTPLTSSFVTRSLAPLCAHYGGTRTHPDKFSIQELVHSASDRDIQKEFHRDTFHQAIKVWFFLDDVTEADGPLIYVPRSHRLDRPRATWEYSKSVDASRRGLGGAFRITAREIAELGLPEPKPILVPANTLVIANIRGFHRRGEPTGDLKRRVALHASLRPSPFVPFPY